MKTKRKPSAAKKPVAAGTLQLRPAVTFKPCRLTFYPPWFVWQRLHELHMVATGQRKKSKSGKKTFPAKKAKAAYGKVLALSMAQMSVIADSSRITMFDGILDAISQLKSLEGLETPFLSGLSSALTLNYSAGITRARSLWSRYQAPRFCGGGASFSMIVDPTTSMTTFIKAATLQQLGPKGAHASIVGKSLGNIVLAVQSAGLADAGVAQDGDQACKNRVTWNTTVTGGIAGAIGGAATGVVAGAVAGGTIAGIPSLGLGAPVGIGLGAILGGVGGAITGGLAGGAAGASVGAAKANAVCGDASESTDDTSDTADDSTSADDSSSESSTQDDTQDTSSSTSDDTGGGDSGSGTDDNSGNDDNSGMPNPDDPNGMPDPDDPHGFALFGATFPVGSAVANAVVPVSAGVWSCHATPALNADGTLARAGLLVAIPAFAKLVGQSAANAANGPAAGVATLGTSTIATNGQRGISTIDAGAARGRAE